ncbi:uncharacterized protein LOC129599503 [Paramacrobiotus metropolitanus]|uniref:uncharacterized protein LOC129599503 n=1 Tax=Paramacrobiotus metropolitanus TaxID=2943436 RepID=UPI0024459A58|nr:uncharacterized protein LOC129599503 [Paramacrobiotus metropolitanus]
MNMEKSSGIPILPENRITDAAQKPLSLDLKSGNDDTTYSSSKGESEGSLSHEDYSRTPDSGPNGDFEEEDLSKPEPDSQDVSPLDDPESSDLVEFVVDDFVQRIREGGPVGSSSAFSLVPVDPRILQNLDQLIQKLCENVAEMNTILSGQIQQMCRITAEHVRTYRSGIEKTCDNVDICIKTMYQLMARTEEVHRQMGQISQVYDQVKELKRMVTILEGYVDSL